MKRKLHQYRSYSPSDLTTKTERLTTSTCPICLFDGQFHSHILKSWTIDINPLYNTVTLRGVMVCPEHGQFVATEIL